MAPAPEGDADRWRQTADSLRLALDRTIEVLDDRFYTSLTFQDGNAEEAMDFYATLFGEAKVLEIQRWGSEMPGMEGKIMRAKFSLDGNRFVCSDSPPVHAWDFTPAVSVYVECESAERIETLYAGLSEGGQTPMPLADYGFSERFAWLIDRYGVGWQLNLD
jgi:predicted 3-demethylubiquinone-9 3-methyltransferase (glyoxalase superfamily)